MERREKRRYEAGDGSILCEVRRPVSLDRQDKQGIDVIGVPIQMLAFGLSMQQCQTTYY